MYDTTVSFDRQASTLGLQSGLYLILMNDALSKESIAGIQVISRAAAILRAVKEENTGMSLGKIADKIDLPRSTVQRIVAALEHEKLLVSSSNGGGVRLGSELLSLGVAARYNIVERCRPHLQALMQQTGETVDLAVLRGRNMVFLDQIQGGGRLRTISSVGEEFPLTTTANGRACLAKLSKEKAKRLSMEEWQEFGMKSNWSKLSKQLADIGKTHIAYDLNDHTSGISAVGFAFFDSIQDLHAISVPVPSSRYTEKSKKVIKALKETRLALLRDLAL